VAEDRRGYCRCDGVKCPFYSIMVALALWIRLYSAGPVFYRQECLGKKFQRFQMITFRIMVVDAD